VLPVSARPGDMNVAEQRGGNGLRAYGNGRQSLEKIEFTVEPKAHGQLAEIALALKWTQAAEGPDSV